MSNSTPLRFAAALGFMLLTSLTNSTLAQPLPPGKDCYAFPAGGKAGQVVEARLGGSDWTPDVQFFCYDKRVKLEVLGPPGEVLIPEPPFWFGIKSFNNDPRLPREVAVRFHLPADMPSGPVRWGVANANGAGGGGVFIVGTTDEVIEDEIRKAPQELKALPVTVNGRLRRIEEVDRYRFIATTSGPVTCSLAARQLGHDFNVVLEVLEGETRIAEALDTEGIDPVLTFRAEKGRTYTVAVRDVDHRGYRNFTYRLQLTQGPRLITAIPPAGKPGEKRSVEFIGVGIATGRAKVERVTREITFPNGTVGESFVHRLETPHGTTQPFAFQLSDITELIEPGASDPNARKLSLPCAVSGRIGQRGERDTYTFAGKKGDVWEFAVQAKQIGSSVDATLTILGPDGKQLATNDDNAGSSDPRLMLTLPADGEYQIIVADVSGKLPGLDAVYRLVARRPASGFSLRTVAMANVPIGGKAPLKVDLIREGGFKGPVTLTFAGLPDGVTLPKAVVIGGNVATLSINLECAATAGASASFVQITGVATVDDRSVTVPALAADGDNIGSHILVATTMKVPFKVKSPDADNTRKAPRGATHLADLIIERTEGFAGEILLDMAGVQSRHRQGIRGPVFKVAPNQDKILYPVTVPEWLESTRTSRIALVAMAKIPDPEGTPRWVMTAMDGQVTMSISGALMKLSHGADELTAVVGTSAEVPLWLSRSPELSGSVKVELVVPAELSGVISAAPFEWPADKATGVLKLVSKDDPRLVGTWKFTARATGSRDGHPVVSETEFEVEFTAPTKSK